MVVLWQTKEDTANYRAPLSPLDCSWLRVIILYKDANCSTGHGLAGEGSFIYCF